MYYRVQISPGIEFTRFREVASTRLCHSQKVFERSPGEHWLESTENLYQLEISPDGFVTGTITTKRPCSEFIDLVTTFGANATLIKNHEEKEFDWDTLSKSYEHPLDKGVIGVSPSITELSPKEKEVLRTIQLSVTNPDGWIPVTAFANRLTNKLLVTLKSLSNKGFISFIELHRAVRLR